jgi:hypothetical protein
MNAAALLNELCARDVALLFVSPDRLRFEAKEAFGDDLLADLRSHKTIILAILKNQGSSDKLLGRRCPYCRLVGMKIEETWKVGLKYFDTRCKHCGEIVETYVPADYEEIPDSQLNG